jgi:dTMP kinase
MAARAQHLAHVIRPALQNGQVVLCDRYFDSTLAYQGYGPGMPLSHLRQLQTLTSEGLSPDLTLLFDLPVAKGLSRRHQSQYQNRLDREAKAFHERVRQGFLTLARRHPRRIKTIQAGKPVLTVARQVDQQIARLFGIT